MNIEPDTVTETSSPGPTKEGGEIAELEFEEDFLEKSTINHPPIVLVTEAKEGAGSEAQFSLPSIFQEKVLDIVLKLYPVQAGAQPQLWLGLRSGQHPPLLRVLEGLDLAQLPSQLASLLEEYARQIEATNAGRAVVAAKPKVATTLVPQKEKLTTTLLPVQPAQPTAIKEAGKDKSLEQLSFF